LPRDAFRGNRSVRAKICYPTPPAVTDAEAYGNEISTFARPTTPPETRKPLILLDLPKLARHLLYVWYKNNNKHCNSE